MLLGAQSGRQAVQATPVRGIVPRHPHLTVQNVEAPRVGGVRGGRAGVLQQLGPLHAVVGGPGHNKTLQPEQRASVSRPHHMRRSFLRAGSDV